MSKIRLIDAALMDTLIAAARAAPRRRMNHNFHPHNDYPGHRLLIAIEPDSYVPPHRHLDPHKDETFVVLRGRVGLLEFDEQGQCVSSVELAAGTACCGADVPHGTFHTLVALESGTVFMEAKSGPYKPLDEGEKASWAPAEGAVEVAAYVAVLQGRFTSP